jgi:hypothetical protein
MEIVTIARAGRSLPSGAQKIHEPRDPRRDKITHGSSNSLFMHLDDTPPSRDIVFKPSRLPALDAPISIGPPPRFRSSNRQAFPCDVRLAGDVHPVTATDGWTLTQVAEYFLFVAGLNGLAVICGGALVA